jgi:hypothetical protein
MPVLPGRRDDETDMDYDSIAKAGLDAGLRGGDRHGRDHLHGAALERPVVLLFRGILRPVHALPARAPAGCIRVVHAIENGQGRWKDLALLDNVADNIAGRTICALGDAAALPVKSFLKHFRHEFVHHIEHKNCLVRKGQRAQEWGRGPGPFLQFCRKTESGDKENAQSRDRRQGSRSPARLDRDGRDQQARHLRAALLLSQEAVDRRQLPHVPGRGGKGAQAAAGLRRRR